MPRTIIPQLVLEHVIYKIITKLLANRFKSTLYNIISPFQMAFVPSRNIKENTMVAYKLFHHLKKKTGKKRFNRYKIQYGKRLWFCWVRFPFYGDATFGIQPKIDKPDKEYVTIATFLVFINGSTRGFFKAQRGFRQGDPILPFLFILNMEVLSRLLIHSKAQGIFEGIRLSKNSPPISHFLFADDIIIFGKNSQKNAQVILGSLEKDQLWSRQKINQSKSSIFITRNTNTATKATISHLLTYKYLDARMKYLGLSTSFNRIKKENYQELLERVGKKNIRSLEIKVIFVSS